MADKHTPHFRNDKGVKVIEIGVKSFKCAGATAPFDHPHVFLDMGPDDQVICPYCSTLYKLNDALASDEAIPPESVYPIEEIA